MIIRDVALVPPGDIARYAWSHLRRFHYVGYVSRLITALHAPPANQEANVNKQAEQIRFCLQQAEEYAEAARTCDPLTKLEGQGLVRVYGPPVPRTSRAYCDLGRPGHVHAYRGAFSRLSIHTVLRRSPPT
jgi:hypothetical protein